MIEGQNRLAVSVTDTGSSHAPLTGAGPLLPSTTMVAGATDGSVAPRASTPRQEAGSTLAPATSSTPSCTTSPGRTSGTGSGDTMLAVTSSPADDSTLAM